MMTRQAADTHVIDRIDDFLAGRLDPEAETAVEAHLLSCDECFARYMALTLPEI
jgi:anti-sigma factor RsiW